MQENNDHANSTSVDPIVMRWMDDNEAIATVDGGGRCITRHTLNREWEPESVCGFVHKWRTVACNSERDVVECSICGKQTVCACDFDDEYA